MGYTGKDYQLVSLPAGQFLKDDLPQAVNTYDSSAQKIVIQTGVSRR